MSPFAKFMQRSRERPAAPPAPAAANNASPVVSAPGIAPEQAPADGKPAAASDNPQRNKPCAS
jgi:hypothetical protein